MEAYIDVAAVFEPGRKKVTRLFLHSGFAKREVADFSPIDLQIFSRQSFKSQSEIPGSQLAFPAQFTHIVVEGRLTSREGMIALVPRHLQHPYHRQILVKPALNPPAKDIGGTAALARFWLLIHLLF